ncbi:MAG: universal stress protein [Acidobacteriota bacterium]
MKVLFGYNGSPAGAAAIADLKNAGLPDDSEIMVLTVAEAWSDAEQVKHDAECIASSAAEKLRFDFPHAEVTVKASSGSPAAEILEAAKQFQPDLIILAEREQTLNERNIFLGTTTKKVMTEADCSVRIARGHANGLAAHEVVIGFDGSMASQAAVEIVARRNWPRDTKFCLAVVADSSVLCSLGRFMSPPETAPKITQQWGEALADSARRRLCDTGGVVSVVVSMGNAKEALVELAKKRGACSLFVGPHCKGNSFEQYIIGSVSSAVAARAECSVEVARPVKQ